MFCVYEIKSFIFISKSKHFKTTSISFAAVSIPYNHDVMCKQTQHLLQDNIL